MTRGVGLFRYWPLKLLALALAVLLWSKVKADSIAQAELEAQRRTPDLVQTYTPVEPILPDTTPAQRADSVPILPQTNLP